MSLMNTVTKMAIGFAVAKGMEAVQRNGGVSSLMEGLTSGGSQKSAGLGGIGNLLGQLGAAGSGGAPGGLGDLLGQLTGGATSGAAGGGLGGLGGLLGGLAGARGGAAAGGFDSLLNHDNPSQEPDEEDVARLMLRAMTQAARSDGDIDADEKAKLLDLLQDSDPSDMEVVQSILEEPVSAATLAADTPKGLETQVYTMSLNAIDPDNRAEGQYLASLAEGLGLPPETVNGLHDSLGAPRLYE
ncbi:MAG: DUF533 domain-containing protein [Roseobacter sp.]